MTSAAAEANGGEVLMRMALRRRVNRARAMTCNRKRVDPITRMRMERLPKLERGRRRIVTRSRDSRAG